MIVFVKMAECIFLAFTVIRTMVYGTWNFKNHNIGGAICLFLLCLIAISLFALTIISDYR